MSVNVSDLKIQFADLKYEQLLAEKYFIETCFSKKFESLTSKQKLKNLYYQIIKNTPQCEGITMIDCHLPQVGCDANGNSTTSTTTTTTSI